MSAQQTEPADLVAFRLSPQQQLLWELGASDPGYRTQCVATLPAGCEANRVRDALLKTVDRYEALRTVFVKRAGMRLPSQVVRDLLEPSWQVDEGDGTLDDVIDEEGVFAFDLEHGPVLRARLVRFADASTLILTASSACADAASLAIVARELVATLARSEPDSAEQPLQYADYAEWRNETIDTREETPTRADDAPVSPVLLFGKRSAPDRPFAAERVEVPLERLDMASLRSSAKLHRASSALFAEAVWHACIGRLSTAADVVVGSLSAGRAQPELAGAVGPYEQTFPVQTHIGEATTVAEVVDQVSRAHDALARWDDAADAATLADAVERSRISFTALETGRAEGVSLHALFGRPASFELQLVWTETDEGPRAELQYAPIAYARDDAVLIAQHFATLLASAVEHPHAEVAELELVTPAERERPVREWNRTDADYPRRAIHELFESQAERTPTRPAVRAGDSELTYAELNAGANRVGHRLRQLGVGRNTAVGLCMHRSADMLVALLGILKAGGAYLPLNYEHPHDRVRHQLTEAGAQLVLTEEDLLDRLPDFGGTALVVGRDIGVDEPDENPVGVNEQEDLVYVMYTSGSTGLPKGVAVTHGNLVNYTTAIADKLGVATLGGDEAAQFGVVSAISTDLGNTAIFPPLIAGGCVNLIAPDVAMDPHRFASSVRQHVLDVVKITPSHLRSLLAGADGDDVLPRRWLVLGGEALPWDLVDEIRTRAPGLRILNHYGPTETTVGCCTCEVGDRDEAAATVPVGRPIANTRAYVVDARSVPVPAGVPGELWIGGSGVARGYVNRPEETSERFLDDPFAGDGRVYRTGDRARRLTDGRIEFMGRIDEQVKIRGFRVEPGEVESALARHPAVRQAAVVAQGGQDELRLVAYLVPSSAPSAEELKAFLAGLLPDFMVPSAFVHLDSLPLTPSGKIDRRALPDPADAGRATEYVAPRTDLEKGIARIWEELLHVDEVGLFDDFFELGGHSLLATQLVIRIRNTYADIPLHSVFTNPTIAGLAEVVLTVELERMEAEGEAANGAAEGAR